MKNEWENTKETILGFQCLRHRVTKELAIFALHGEIYLKNSTTCKTLIRSPGKLGIKPPFKYRWTEHDEVSIEFPVSEIQKYMDLLRIPKKVSTQLRYANDKK